MRRMSPMTARTATVLAPTGFIFSTPPDCVKRRRLCDPRKARLCVTAKAQLCERREAHPVGRRSRRRGRLSPQEVAFSRRSRFRRESDGVRQQVFQQYRLSSTRSGTRSGVEGVLLQPDRIGRLSFFGSSSHISIKLLPVRVWNLLLCWRLYVIRVARPALAEPQSARIG